MIPLRPDLSRIGPFEWNWLHFYWSMEEIVFSRMRHQRQERGVGWEEHIEGPFHCPTIIDRFNRRMREREGMGRDEEGGW